LDFVVLPLFGFGVAFLIFAFKRMKKRDQATYFSIAIVILSVVAGEIEKSETFKSPIVLKASLRDDLFSIHLWLRRNKTFEVHVVTMFYDEEFSDFFLKTFFWQKGRKEPRLRW
jgi:hypothetical protein